MTIQIVPVMEIVSLTQSQMQEARMDGLLVGSSIIAQGRKERVVLVARVVIPT